MLKADFLGNDRKRGKGRASILEAALDVLLTNKAGFQAYVTAYGSIPGGYRVAKEHRGLKV